MTRTGTSSERTTYRLDIRLRPSDKRELKRLAAQENTSSSEVIRRLINRAHFLQNQPEKETMEAVLRMISEAASEANQNMNGISKKMQPLNNEKA
jgi:predicted CopG family antitoxin